MAGDIVAELQDFTALDWSESCTTSATGGSYLKARRGTGATAVYYKLSCYDEVNGIYGHECVNEIIAARVMQLLGVNHVPYRLVHAKVRIDGQVHETWLAASESFRDASDSKVALGRFYAWNRLPGEKRLALCERFGWLGELRKMMLVDYLIANRDRHGGNIEVLQDRRGNLRLAPLLDNGLSLCFSTYRAQDLAAIDPLQDVVANNFLGTRSPQENLVKFVPGKLPIGRLHESSGKTVTEGLAPALEHAVQGVPGREFLGFLWNMVWERWCAYEALRNSGRLQAQG